VKASRLLLLAGLLACSSLLPSRAAAAEGLQLRGSLYELGSARRVKLYTWQMHLCSELWTSHYRRLNGTLVVEDFTRFSGERLVEYGYVRHTIGERSSVRVRGSHLDFRYRRGPRVEVATLSTDGVFLTGPAVFPYIRRHLPRLLGGESVEFKYGVLDRLDYFTFALSSQSKPHDTTLVVRLRATSPFVRMAVDPIDVTLSPRGSFEGIRGRTIIMETKGEGLVPIDADLVVEAEAPLGCGPAVGASTRSESGIAKPGDAR